MRILGRIASFAAATRRRAMEVVVNRDRLRLVEWMRNDGAPHSR